MNPYIVIGKLKYGNWFFWKIKNKKNMAIGKQYYDLVVLDGHVLEDFPKCDRKGLISQLKEFGQRLWII